MKIQVIIGSVREGRTAIKVARWVQKGFEQLGLNTVQLELVDLKEWDLPIFSGANPPMTGIYDQPKQQAWADHIAQGDAFIFISPEYNHGYSPALKNALDYLGKEWQGKPAAYIVRTPKNQYNTDMSYPIHFRKKILAKLEEGQSIRAVAQHFEINKALD